MSEACLCHRLGDCSLENTDFLNFRQTGMLVGSEVLLIQLSRIQLFYLCVSLTCCQVVCGEWIKQVVLNDLTHGQQLLMHVHSTAKLVSLSTDLFGV